jgi:hypothetical protein
MSSFEEDIEEDVDEEEVEVEFQCFFSSLGFTTCHVIFHLFNQFYNIIRSTP